MSSKTQIALATIIGSALLWIAYASVNVVFKEQIIVAKERDARTMELKYSRQILQQQQAYADIDALHKIARQQFDSEIDVIRARHETLRNMVERATAVNVSLEKLSEELSRAGAPNGATPANGNRIMVDETPGEPTPRQSRTSALQRDALLEAKRRIKDGAGWTASGADGSIGNEFGIAGETTSTLFADQMVLLASLEEQAARKAQDLRNVLAAIGLNADSLIAPSKIRNPVLAQGGPFIAADNVSDFGSPFFEQANRTSAVVQELATYFSIIRNVPLSSPLIGARRFTSGYGVRKDPFTGRRANHYGIDFAAAWAAPVRATADAVVSFSGTRSGYGLVVELDHGNGFKTRFAHLSRRSVSEGERVKLHDKIGELGSSGRSSGPHVHYEILFKGKPLDPQRFIEAGRYVFEG